MSKAVIELQEGFPESIRLFRNSPQRDGPLCKSINPKNVKSSGDLPTYLIMGNLDESAFRLTSDGWTATWQGAESNTQLVVTYLLQQNRYEISQTWFGVNGGFSTYPANISLDQHILQTLYTRFPKAWDVHAKKYLENKYQITYIEQPEGMATICGVPDGAFRTVAFPISVKNLRPVRDWIQGIVGELGLHYPISIEAKILHQVINYLEGKAPEWTSNPSDVFGRSLHEMGLFPLNFPVRETADDGSSAWTLRRNIYVIFIGIPFAGLTDLLDKLASNHGPIRHTNDPELRIELQPFIIPAAFEIQVNSFSYFDKNKTTRSFWQFEREGHQIKIPNVEDVIYAESRTEELLNMVESLGSNVEESINEILRKIQGAK